MIVFLSLGTNIGDRLHNLEKVYFLIEMEEKINIISKSKIYETSPVENLNQEYFLNQIIKIDTDIEPLQLLNLIKSIENQMGRIELKKKYMPRIIDIDILAYQDLILNNEILCIPHPKIKFRKFILKPWTDISPDYILPNSKYTIKELLDKVNHLDDTVKEYN